jgi:hypothetical protein
MLKRQMGILFLAFIGSWQALASSSHPEITIPSEHELEDLCDSYDSFRTFERKSPLQMLDSMYKETFRGQPTRIIESYIPLDFLFALETVTNFLEKGSQHLDLPEWLNEQIASELREIQNQFKTSDNSTDDFEDYLREKIEQATLGLVAQLTDKELSGDFDEAEQKRVLLRLVQILHRLFQYSPSLLSTKTIGYGFALALETNQDEIFYSLYNWALPKDAAPSVFLATTTSKLEGLYLGLLSYCVATRATKLQRYPIVEKILETLNIHMFTLFAAEASPEEVSKLFTMVLTNLSLLEIEAGSSKFLIKMSQAGLLTESHIRKLENLAPVVEVKNLHLLAEIRNPNGSHMFDIRSFFPKAVGLCPQEAIKFHPIQLELLMNEGGFLKEEYVLLSLAYFKKALSPTFARRQRWLENFAMFLAKEWVAPSIPFLKAAAEAKLLESILLHKRNEGSVYTISKEMLFEYLKTDKKDSSYSRNALWKILCEREDIGKIEATNWLVENRAEISIGMLRYFLFQGAFDFPVKPPTEQAKKHRTLLKDVEGLFMTVEGKSISLLEKWDEYKRENRRPSEEWRIRPQKVGVEVLILSKGLRKGEIVGSPLENFYLVKYRKKYRFFLNNIKLFHKNELTLTHLD